MTAIQDQVILVTGSTDGIGKQTAHDLAKMVGEMFGEYRGCVQSGADAIISVATSHELEGVTGKYFDQMQQAQAIAVSLAAPQERRALPCHRAGI